jgi:hypothetical protein
MGTFAMYLKKDGTWTYRKFYAQFTVPGRYRIGGASYMEARPGNTKAREQKKNFALLVLTGLDLPKCFKIAFPNIRTIGDINRKITKLLGDQIVKENILEQIVSFSKNLDEKYSDDKILEMIEKHMDATKAGTKQYLDNIEFLLKVRKLRDEAAKTRMINNGVPVQDTPYTEIGEEPEAP